MSNKKISQLPAATTSLNNDLIPIVQGNLNKKSNPVVLGIINTNTAVTTTAVGGLAAGSSVLGDTPIDTLNKILFPYLNPAFTSFYITGATPQECGQKIVGPQSFAWAISNSGNVNANSVDILDVTKGLTLISDHSIVSPASYNFDNYQQGGLEYDDIATNTWIIGAINTHAVGFVRYYQLSWYLRAFSGSSINSTLTNAEILALANSALASTFPTQVVVIGGNYLQYWIPASFVQPTTFKDAATGFSIAMAASVTQDVTNSYGVTKSYIGRRSEFILTTGTTIAIS
jgi:hypothetical protein